MVAAGAAPWTGLERSSLLLFLLAPALPLGLDQTPRRLVGALLPAAAVLAVGGAVHGLDDRGEYAAACAQWLLLSLALGLVVTWARHLSTEQTHADDYVAVRSLLEQLHGLTRRLPGGLDAASTAESLLDRCARHLDRGRCAVVVQPAGGAFVPLAVRGAQRVPWRNPLDTDGPLRRAWETQQPVVDRREADADNGRRRGSCLLAVPIVSSGTPFGLVILESPLPGAFHDDVVAEVQRLVEEAAVPLETALLFDEVTLQVTTEERDRLAREMHDGIAQELASFGYVLDDLRLQAQAVDANLGTSVSAVRRQLTDLISDLRLSITDLRTSVRTERGLGAALGTYLRAVCAGKDVVLTLQLHESAFRLPAEQEVALFKAAQAFAQEVRQDGTVTALLVHLVVDPPSALLTMRCIGGAFEVSLGDAGAALARLGAVVTTSDGPGAAPRLSVELRKGPP